jgi:hypothetical protein
MCDTLVAGPSVTAAGTTLFGKNSDRQRNEAQLVEVHPPGRYGNDARVGCTYIEIPQAPATVGVLLSRPQWMWGAEMGANTAGVVIGNEGLHSRNPAPTHPALTGMDLVRLGLERGDSAEAALHVIIELLKAHGQGGNGGHRNPAYYNNGFLIADTQRAFVLETIESEWFYESVSGARAISNIYSVETPVVQSDGLDRLLKLSDLCTGAGNGVASRVTHPDREHIGQAGARRARTGALLDRLAGSIVPADVRAILRDHGGGRHSAPSVGAITLCMHAGGASHEGQTTGSLVSDLAPDRVVHWLTGTAAPCISIFKPAFADVPLPAEGGRGGDHYDPRSLWWRHELFHRRALTTGLSDTLAAIAVERDAIEADFERRIATVRDADVAAREATVAACWRDAEALELRWLSRLPDVDVSLTAAKDAHWAEMSQAAQFPERDVHDNIS